MAEKRKDPDDGIAGVVNGSLYPDLLRDGGLASAMRRLASRGRWDLGRIETDVGPARFVSATMSSDRGRIAILLGAEKRFFSIRISHLGHVWASGATDDLAAVTGVADAWRKGATLDELVHRFPFMHTNALALAFERGDPIPTQWDELLGHPELVHVRPLLNAAHSDERLRALFPYVSHGTLRLYRDVRDTSLGELRLVPLPSGGFRVEATWNDSTGEADSLPEAVRLARSFLP
ncbi:DUF6193 family natural product biosynthesis protein [Microbispora sp. NPDC046973]|uniref:DUF6193 family natural product biosynthesis protein n=1 Tax=Microbispora sp. NPDC046973 TaxID=3155022 RepID=UPI0034042821